MERIATLEADLATSREREAALAGGVEESQELIAAQQAVIETLAQNCAQCNGTGCVETCGGPHGEPIREPCPGCCYRESKAILAARDAEKDKRIAALELALDRACSEFQKTLDAHERDNISPSADVRKWFGVETAMPMLIAHDADVARKARLEEAQWFEIRAVGNLQCDGNLDVSLSEIRRRIAALKAEGGKG